MKIPTFDMLGRRKSVFYSAKKLNEESIHSDKPKTKRSLQLSRQDNFRQEEIDNLSVFDTSEIEEEIENQGLLSLVTHLNAEQSCFIFEPENTFKA